VTEAAGRVARPHRRSSMPDAHAAGLPEAEDDRMRRRYSTDDLLECVPNFSEGRRPEVVEEIEAAFAGADRGVLVLDRSSDADHDRTVLTLAGPGPALVEAAVAGARACARLIDLNRHRGVHPRLGALDVVPFVPLGEATSLRGGADPDLDCAALAERAGRRIAAEAAVPVYLYGAAARRPERAALPAVRGRGFEAVRAALAAEGAIGGAGRAPDFGGPRLHPTAGATAVGARELLIAYNVELAGADLELARRVAAAVRERDGGLPAVRAMGVALANRGGPGDRRGGPPVDRGGPGDRRGGPPVNRGLVQVSMNLLDYKVTPPAVAFAAVAGLAERAGARVVASEIVGLLPAAALAGVDPADLLLPASTPDRFLEERLARALDTRHGGAPMTRAGAGITTPGTEERR
jgi:glutamate formiminotransferase